MIKKKNKIKGPITKDRYTIAKAVVTSDFKFPEDINLVSVEVVRQWELAKRLHENL